MLGTVKTSVHGCTDIVKGTCNPPYSRFIRSSIKHGEPCFRAIMNRHPLDVLDSDDKITNPRELRNATLVNNNTAKSHR